MEAKARAKYLRSSARKMRLAADLVRAQKVSEALIILQGLPHKASREIEKVIRAAAANLQSQSEGANYDVDDLRVKSIVIDGGPTLKRIKARAQGRAYLRRHHMSHITVVVSD
jgi:large subunit ribosomal protein L22